jgi:hypothetical protein
MKQRMPMPLVKATCFLVTQMCATGCLHTYRERTFFIRSAETHAPISDALVTVSYHKYLNPFLPDTEMERTDREGKVMMKVARVPHAELRVSSSHFDSIYRNLTLNGELDPPTLSPAWPAGSIAPEPWLDGRFTVFLTPSHE